MGGVRKGIVWAELLRELWSWSGRRGHTGQAEGRHLCARFGSLGFGLQVSRADGVFQQKSSMTWFVFQKITWPLYYQRVAGLGPQGKWVPVERCFGSIYQTLGNASLLSASSCSGSLLKEFKNVLKNGARDIAQWHRACLASTVS